MAKWQDTLKVIRKLTKTILTQKVLIIDPSSGGGESKPGFAILIDGRVNFSGTIDVPIHLSLQTRLVDIRQAVSDLVDIHGGGFSLLVVEEIRIIPGSFSGPSVANLLKGVGAIMSAQHFENYLEIPPLQWKRFAVADPNYTKSDEADAIYMAKFLVDLARQFQGGTKLSPDEIAIRRPPSTRKVKLCPTPKKLQTSKSSKRTKTPTSSRASRSTSPRGKSKSIRSKK